MTETLSFLREWLTPQGFIALAALYAAVQAERARRASAANALTLRIVGSRIEVVANKVEEVHIATNSIVTAALQAKDEMGKALAAAGVAEGREQMRAEQEDRKP